VEKEKNGEASAEKQTPYLRTGVCSLAINLFLVGVKLSLSFIAGSLALRADAIHSSVDVFGSIALIAGLLISTRKNKNFPYGLYKVENIVAVIISLLLFVSAYEIVNEAIRGGSDSVEYSGWILGIIGALILVPFLFSRYEVGVGKRYNSPSLIADGKQFKADVLSASIVFFALIAQYFGVPLDRIAAGIIALFIIRAGWQLLSSSMRVLLDASVEAETLGKIRSTIESEPAVISVKHLTGRNSGRYIFVEADVELRIADLQKAHLVSKRVEQKIKDEIPSVDRTLIHYEPAKKSHIRYAVALLDRKGVISQHFGEAPFFALIDLDVEKGDIIRQEIIANPHVELKKGKGIQVARFLLEHKPDVIVARESLLGKGPGYAFADAGVKTVQTEYSTLDELAIEIATLSNDSLEEKM